MLGRALLVYCNYKPQNIERNIENMEKVYIPSPFLQTENNEINMGPFFIFKFHTCHKRSRNYIVFTLPSLFPYDLKIIERDVKSEINKTKQT